MLETVRFILRVGGFGAALREKYFEGKSANFEDYQVFMLHQCGRIELPVKFGQKYVEENGFIDWILGGMRTVTVVALWSDFPSSRSDVTTSDDAHGDETVY